MSPTPSLPRRIVNKIKRTLKRPSNPLAPASPLVETHAYPSYSQSGEDRIVNYFFETIRLEVGPRIRYADLGAADPSGHNNTYLFYSQGASGLLVEADPAYLPAYCHVRPRDVVEQVAIVPSRLRHMDTVTFYAMEDRGWSTISTSHVERARQLEKGDTRAVIQVPCMTINELLSKHFSDGQLDILSIDLEGIDSEVLAELDLTMIRPKVILVENSSNPLEPDASRPNVQRLIGAGYDFFASSFVNSIFVDSETRQRMRV